MTVSIRPPRAGATTRALLRAPRASTAFLGSGSVCRAPIRLGATWGRMGPAGLPGNTIYVAIENDPARIDFNLVAGYVDLYEMDVSLQ